MRTASSGRSLWLIGFGLLAAATTTAVALTSGPSRVLLGRGEPECDATDAARGRPATASSVEGVRYAAAGAVDGDGRTRWASRADGPQWIQVDLGTVQRVCAVVLHWAAAYATAYQIRLSPDATTWTTVYSRTGGTGGTESARVDGAGRYLRLYATARATAQGYSLWDMVVRVEAADWTPVWRDDFAGPAGSPPSAGWIARTGTTYPGGPARWGTGEVETMTAAARNLALDGHGHLAITAINEGGAWTSGRVESRRADFAAPPGGMLRISASLQQPATAHATGYWPKFWTLGVAYRTQPAAWPGVGESDIMEDANGRDQVASTLHCGSAPDGPCNESTGLTSGLLTCPGCQAGYHTYAEVVDRTKPDEQIRWYLDDQQIWVVNESDVGVAAWQAAVGHGVFLNVALAVGGSLPDAVCACVSPAAGASSGGVLRVDWVSVEVRLGRPPPSLGTPAVPAGASVVKVAGGRGDWHLEVNGSAFQVKGVTYGLSTEVAGAYLPDLKAMGVNTLRTWGTGASTRPLLDAAAAYGVRVINGFWLDQGADYVNDAVYRQETLAGILRWVDAYKSHPGVLMWDVGNEVLYGMAAHYAGAQVEAERVAYARYVDQVARAIHAADPNHPVTSTDAWTGAWSYYQRYAPHLDLYAINAYGGVCGLREAWRAGRYPVPYILTEGGPPRESELSRDANGVPAEPTDTQNRDGYRTAWACLTGDTGVALGGTLFNYGIDNDFAGVWLNLVPGRWKRLAYYEVRALFGGAPATDTPPVITGMTVAPRVPADGRFTVTATVRDPEGDPVHFGLMLSSRYVDGATGLRHATFTQTGPVTFDVAAPGTPGVWKVYLYASDGHGNVGIETRSFVVG